jgi:hypothetical protein
MIKSMPTITDERIVDAMIQLARVTKSHRVIVAGTNSAEVLLKLRRRNYLRVTTTKIWLVPCRQFDVALIAWREQSIKTLKATLDRLAQYVSAFGALVLWIDPHERIANQALGLVVHRLGFRIESGTRCENGIAIAARRLDSVPAAKAA